MTKDNINFDIEEQTQSGSENKNQEKETQTKNEKQEDILFENIYNKLSSSAITYKDVGEYFLDNYTSDCTNNSNIIDVIGIYIKGQKILYTEAKTTCEQRLTFLMLPSILFTILSSIINLLIDDIRGKIITTSLNGLITFTLSVINFLKLDARAEAHRSSAYKYDKLLTYIEFQSCKQLFLHFEKNKMPEVFTKIENDVKDIKETNQFVLPEVIRYNFPILTNINIFSEIKKILNKEMILMNKLAYVLNEIRFLEFDIYKNEKLKDESKDELKIKLEIKKSEKQDLTVILLKIQDEYVSLDVAFKHELSRYSNRNKYRVKILEWLKV
jgi:hypothetical protein